MTTSTPFNNAGKPYGRAIRQMMILEWILLAVSGAIAALNGIAYCYWENIPSPLGNRYHSRYFEGYVPQDHSALKALFFVAPAPSFFRASIHLIAVHCKAPFVMEMLSSPLDVMALNIVFVSGWAAQTVFMVLFIHEGGDIGWAEMLEIASAILCCAMFWTYVTSCIIGVRIRTLLSELQPEAEDTVTQPSVIQAQGPPCELCGQATLVQNRNYNRTPELPGYSGEDIRASSYYGDIHEVMSDRTLEAPEQSNHRNSIAKDVLTSVSPSSSSPADEDALRKSYWNMSLHEIAQEIKHRQNHDGEGK